MSYSRWWPNLIAKVTPTSHGHLFKAVSREELNRVVGSFTPLKEAAAYDQTDWVTFLLEIGADPDVVISSSWRATALHAASEIGNIRSVRLLLQGGADASIRNDFGDTAADLAVKTSFYDKFKTLIFHEVFKTLIFAGAKCNISRLPEWALRICSVRKQCLDTAFAFYALCHLRKVKVLSVNGRDVHILIYKAIISTHFHANVY